MSLAAIRGRMASVYLSLNAAEQQLAALHLNDPHAALGITGRRLQQRVDAMRREIIVLRDAAVTARRAA